MNNIVTTRQSLVPTTIEEMEKFAEKLSKSILVPKDYQGKPANCFVAIQWGLECGLAPLQALQSIAVINGKPSMYGDSLLAMVRADSRCLGVQETQEGGVATCIIKRKHSDGSVEEIKRTFSMKQAQQAGLSNRPTWKAYPERMLQHRARGNAIRDAFPDVIHGLISAEEAQDYDEPKDITPTQEAVAAPTIQELTGEEKMTNMTVNSSPEKAEKALEAWGVKTAKVEEAEVVQEEPVSQFDKYLENIVPEKTEAIVAEDFKLYVPNKPDDTKTYQQPLDYMDAYNDLLLAVRRASSLTPAVRRTKMKELEQENTDTFATLPDDMVQELKDKRKQYNAGLSIEEKENG